MIKNFNFKKSSKPLLIAEIGNNHEGSFNRAKKLIDAAKIAGADAVKFQTLSSKKFFHFSEVEKIKKYKKFELTKKQFKKLSFHAKKNNMLFLSTPFDLESADFLRDIVDIIKISSGDNTFLPLIDRCLAFNKPIIISTGLLKENEILNLYNYIRKKKII